MPQMLDDRLADVAGQGQLVGPVSLAVDDDLPGTPIEIAPRSRGGLPAPWGGATTDATRTHSQSPTKE
jgi:hypothetical protein